MNFKINYQYHHVSPHFCESKERAKNLTNKILHKLSSENKNYFTKERLDICKNNESTYLCYKNNTRINYV